MGILSIFGMFFYSTIALIMYITTYIVFLPIVIVYNIFASIGKTHDWVMKLIVEREKG